MRLSAILVPLLIAEVLSTRNIIDGISLIQSSYDGGPASRGALDGAEPMGANSSRKAVAHTPAALGWLDNVLARFTASTGIDIGEPWRREGRQAEQKLPHSLPRRTPPKSPDMTAHAWIVLAIMLACLIVLFLELFPPYLVLLTGLCVVWCAGVISTRDAIRGFSNDALVTVGALLIVVKGVDRARVIDGTVSQCLGENSSECVALLRFCAVVFVFGGVMNNTPLVALLMPVIRDWCRERGFAPSKFLMPLAYASMGGGQMTIVGSSTNLMVAGMLQEETGETFTFFDPARTGAIVNLFAMGYLVLVGVRMLPEGGGLFKTLKEKKEDMVTQLQVLPNCPLVGTDLNEAMEQLLVPREAVLKIFRQPPRRKLSKLPERLRTGSTGDLEKDGAIRKVSFRLPTDEERTRRISRLWGIAPGRPRASSDWVLGPRGQDSPTTTGLRAGTALAAAEELLPPGHPSTREIFPVPEFETVEAGDVLLLSLPQEKCLALTESDHVAQLLENLASTGADEHALSKEARERQLLEAARSLRICNVDLLDVPGRENEFAELVVSQQSPFIGRNFTSTETRQDFEEKYQVAILAIRQARGSGMRSSRKPASDQLPSISHGRGERLAEAMRTGHRGARDRGVTWGGEDIMPHRPVSDRAVLEGSPEEAVAEDPEPEQQWLTPGDTVLVLAKSGESMEKLSLSSEFLVVTQVARDVEVPRKIWDHLPGMLFFTALVLVALGIFPMVKVTLALAAIYMVVGWVDPAKLRENVDWNLLALIGCSLGLASAVQDSGLSAVAAHHLQKANLGVYGTVYVLFLFVMLISELVTQNAAAALGFPLAIDLTTSLGLMSAKPLAMVVVLASNVSFMNPVSSAATLMTMGPGGYRFMDFLKVGFGMDLIYWLGCSTLIPLVWSMEQYPPGSG
jgi:di/tricarboxylate transporter